MQVYRQMDIGTAKPTPAERAAVPHYGLDLVDPDQPFSVAEYVNAVMPGIEETQRAGAIPLIVGGTRLYIQALSGHFDRAAPPNPELRRSLYAEAGQFGAPALHARLASVDPEAATRVHPNDLKRIVRALEVHHAMGQAISDVQARSRQVQPLADALIIALVRDRETLYRIVEERTRAMIQAGWIDEVRRLVTAGYGPWLDLTKAHGYRELAAYLGGSLTLEDAEKQIDLNVRHYVRYQLGWIRQMAGIHILNAGASPTDLACELIPLVESWIGGQCSNSAVA
jgi:tRNA dimethylallyltransferase